MDIAYGKIHPVCRLSGSLKEASHELHSLCRARNDERGYRNIVAAVDDLERKTVTT